MTRHAPKPLLKRQHRHLLKPLLLQPPQLPQQQIRRRNHMENQTRPPPALRAKPSPPLELQRPAPSTLRILRSPPPPALTIPRQPPLLALIPRLDARIVRPPVIPDILI